MLKKPKFRSVKIKNLKQEKEKFFSQKNYNPQFEYEKPIEKESLVYYGLPERDLFEYSKFVINKALSNYGSYSQALGLEGSLLNLEESKENFNKYLYENEIFGKVIIQYSDDLVARTNTALNDENKIVLKIRTPASYYSNSIHAVLDHEIGTHVFRWINERRQSWHNHEARNKFSDHLVTEEGLATLHWLMTHPINLPLQQAIYYYACFLAQYLSFVELYSEILRFVEDPEHAWFFTVRAKRGMENTQNPGGFTKDIVYIKGLWDVATWLNYNDFKIENLYLGKISTKDIEKCIDLARNYKPILPFLVKQSGYHDRAFSVIKKNGLLEI